MTTYDLTALSATPDLFADRLVPESAILDFLQGPDESLHDFNGGDLASEFPPYPLSLTSAVSALIAARPDLRKAYPRLEHFFSGAPPTKIPQLQSVLSTRLMDSKFNTLKFIASRERMGGTIPSINLSMAEAISAALPQLDSEAKAEQVELRAAAWMNTNISQSSRAAQMQFRNSAITMSMRCIAVLTNWCRPRHYSFSLRMPLTMGTNLYFDLLRVDKSEGLKFIKMSYSTSMATALRFLDQYELPKYLFPPITDDYVKEEHNALETFHFWHGVTGNAILRSESGNNIGIIGPSGIDAIVAMHPFNRFPIYQHEPRSTFLIQDQLYEIGTVSYPDADSFNAAMQVLALLSTLVSIICATIPTGRGNHKPSWVHSPLNSELVDFVARNGNRFIDELMEF